MRSLYIFITRFLNGKYSYDISSYPLILLLFLLYLSLLPFLVQAPFLTLPHFGDQIICTLLLDPLPNPVFLKNFPAFHSYSKINTHI